MKKNQEPWFHIKDVLKYSSKEIIGGFEDIAHMLIGKKNSDSKKK